jgi:hypothetical protein
MGWGVGARTQLQAGVLAFLKEMIISLISDHDLAFHSLLCYTMYGCKPSTALLELQPQHKAALRRSGALRPTRH